MEILVERGGKYWIIKFWSGFECFLLDNEIVPIGGVFCTGKVDGINGDVDLNVMYTNESGGINE